MTRLSSNLHQAFVTSKQTAIRFWHDEQGVIVATELILIGTLLVLGLVAALAVVRAAIVTELGDFASSIGTMSQTYSVGGTAAADGSFTGGSAFSDAADSADDVGPGGQQVGGSSACIVVCSNVVTPG